MLSPSVAQSRTDEYAWSSFCKSRLRDNGVSSSLQQTRGRGAQLQQTGEYLVLMESYDASVKFKTWGHRRGEILINNSRVEDQRSDSFKRPRDG